MSDAYLTIDDSPSPTMQKLIDYLAGRNIPAMFFCRGDRMEQNSVPLIGAVRRGFVLANHNYSHRPAGSLSYEEIVAEIERTESLIDKAYREAGVAKPGQYFRFPYLDRGDGDRVEQRFDKIIADLHAGRSVSLKSDDDALEEKKQKLQDYLAAQGYAQPFKQVSHPLYRVPDIARARDCFMTYSCFEWMLTERHIGKHELKTVDDLKRKIDHDPWLSAPDGRQIILLHDQDELLPVVTDLVEYFQEKGFNFCPFK